MAQIEAARAGRIDFVNSLLEAVFGKPKGGATPANVPLAGPYQYDIPVSEGAAIRDMFVSRFGAKVAKRDPGPRN